MVVEEAHFEHPMTQNMNAAEEYLQASFPPGMRSMLIPNVMDFAILVPRPTEAKAGVMMRPEELKRLIYNRDWKELARHRNAWPEPKVAAPEVQDLLITVEKRDRVFLFRALLRDLAAEVLALTGSEVADRLFLELSGPETRPVLSEMDSDDQAALLDELPADATKRFGTRFRAPDIGR